MSVTTLRRWDPDASMLMPKQRPGDARPDAVRFGPNLTVNKGTVCGRATADNLMYPYKNAVTPEIQTATKTGTWSGGTYTITVDRGGETMVTGPIAYNATAATIQTALENLGNLDTGEVTVSGGPLSTTAVVFTFNVPENMAPITIDVTSVTGSTPGVGVVETQAGATTVTGAEKAMAIAAMSFKTDASSNVYYGGSTTPSVDNPPSQTTFVWTPSGSTVFNPADLTGLDGAAQRDLGMKELPNGFVVF
jgi:hypothetical protein